MRDLNVAPSRQDDRRIEVIANGLPRWGGVQVAVDTTLVSPLTAAGEPRREGKAYCRGCFAPCSSGEGAHLPRTLRCRLVVLGIETGGWWCPEAATFFRLLARCRARSAPPPLQCMHICLRASVVRPARLCRCPRLRDQPPFPAALWCSQCRRRSSAPQ